MSLNGSPYDPEVNLRLCFPNVPRDSSSRSSFSETWVHGPKDREVLLVPSLSWRLTSVVGKQTKGFEKSGRVESPVQLGTTQDLFEHQKRVLQPI